MARRLQRSKILDFKVQIRWGRPCDEWGDAAGAADFFDWRQRSIVKAGGEGSGNAPSNQNLSAHLRYGQHMILRASAMPATGCVAVKAQRPSGTMSAFIEACS